MAARSRRTEIAFAILIALTLFGLWLSRTALDPRIVGGLLLGFATIKGRLLVLDFFGLRAAPGPWRMILTVWIAMVASLALVASLASIWI